MEAIDFLAASGAIGWAVLIWRAYRSIGERLHRLRWALWGYRKQQRRRTT